MRELVEPRSPDHYHFKFKKHRSW